MSQIDVFRQLFNADVMNLLGDTTNKYNAKRLRVNP